MRISHGRVKVAAALLFASTLANPLHSQSQTLISRMPPDNGRIEARTSSFELCLPNLTAPACAPLARPQAVAADLAPVRRESRWPTGINRWDFAAFGQSGDPARGQSTSQSARSSAEQGSPGHIFWVIPAYKVAYLKKVKPLTPREKFDEWARGAYDPLGLAGAAAEAALEYSHSDGFCDYGKHWGGYAKCYGSAELDANISSFFGDFLFPVVMHQDPRYFGMGPGSAGTGTRFLYAVSRVFVTRTDSGGTAPDYAALSGTFLAAAASNLYYPRQDRGFGHSMSRVAWDLGDTALFNVAAEFWPDIKRKVHRIF